MFAWIKSLIDGTASPSLRSFYESISDLNEIAEGRAFTKRKRIVGSLELPSGVAILMDPCSDSFVEVSGFVERRATVSVEEQCDPNGNAVLSMLDAHGHPAVNMLNPHGNAVLGMLELVFDPNAVVDETRTLGTIAIDSTRIAAADRDDWKLHRQEVGSLGELRMTASFDADWKIRFAIAKEFGLDWSEKDRYRMVYVASRPVEQDEYEAMRRVGWLAAGNAPPSDDVYPNFGLAHVTGSTFDRMNEFRGLGFLPIGEPQGPRAFVGTSGAGEGTYEVIGQFAEDRIVRVEIRFLEDSD